MASKKKEVPTPGGSPLTHNPFAGLASNPSLATDTASRAASAAASAAPPAKAPRPVKVRLRLESRGRSGKVVTRVTGLPSENVDAIASRLRKALGCGAIVEGEDVLLQGTLLDRASEWLERAGDLRVISPERTRSSPHVPEPPPAREPVVRGDTPLGTQRGDIRRGQRVAIVQKSDQPTGRLTEGIVRDLLTSSTTHPRGIKVRLETGEVGRVKVVYG